MTLLFDLLSAFYLLRGVQLAYALWRARDQVRAEPLTRWQARMADQAAFFLAVPPAVAVHELGHAAAVWAYGGQVVQFNYRVFWGSVLPRGDFSAEQSWVIAVAGTVGSLLAGGLIWLATRRGNGAMRYFGLRALWLQIFFSLVYYPVFSALGLFGDWVTIYNFSATPWLSGGFALTHAALLFATWWAARRGFFEMPAPGDPAKATALARLEQAVAVAADPDAPLRLAASLRALGAPTRARRILEAYLRRFPHEPRALVQLALAESSGRRQIPRRAMRHAERALAYGLSAPAEFAAAHALLAAREQDMGRPRQALPHLDQAIQALGEAASPALLRQRAQVHRQLGQPEAARQDAARGLALARERGDAGEAALLEELLKDSGPR